MLGRLYSTIRSLRQAQRRALHSYLTFDAAQEALDVLACDGQVRASDGHRIIMRNDGSFVLSLEQIEHN